MNFHNEIKNRFLMIKFNYIKIAIFFKKKEISRKIQLL